MPRLTPAALLALPLLAACADAPPPPPPGDPAADSAFALLTRLAADTLGSDPGQVVAAAYRRLDRYAYTAEVRLTMYDAEGAHTTTRTITRRPTGDGVEERLVAAAGDGAPGQDWTEQLRIENPLPALLPDEPAYLAPRSREDYRYTLGPDTTLGGQRLSVVEAALRPEAGGEQALRRARYFLRPGTDDVLGVEVVRASTSALFDEASQVRVLLQPGPDGTPVPALATVAATVNVPGAPPRRLRLEQRFREVRSQ